MSVRDPTDDLVGCTGEDIVHVALDPLQEAVVTDSIDIASLSVV